MRDSQRETPRNEARAESRSVPAWTAAIVSAVLLTVGGCEVFSFLPFVDDPGEVAEEGAPEPLQVIDAEAVLQRRWQAGVGRGLGRKYLRIKPTILAERIYAADGYGTVVALDRFSGRRIWSTSVGSPDSRPFLKIWDRRDPSFLTGGVGAGEGRILVGTTRGEVIALNAGDGSEVWRTQLTSEILAPPAADDGVVMAQTNDGRLVALEPSDGATRWSYDNQVPLLTLRGTATPVITGGFGVRRLRRRSGGGAQHGVGRADLATPPDAAPGAHRVGAIGGCRWRTPSRAGAGRLVRDQLPGATQGVESAGRPGCSGRCRHPPTSTLPRAMDSCTSSPTTTS